MPTIDAGDVAALRFVLRMIRVTAEAQRTALGAVIVANQRAAAEIRATVSDPRVRRRLFGESVAPSLRQTEDIADGLERSLAHLPAEPAACGEDVAATRQLLTEVIAAHHEAAHAMRCETGLTPNGDRSCPP